MRDLQQPQPWEKVVGFIGVIVAVLLCSHFADSVSELATHAQQVWMLVLIGCLLAPLGIAYALGREEGVKRAGWLIAPFITVALFLAYGTFVYWDSRDSPENNALAAYCWYGSVSQAQLDGCLDHVTPSDLRRDTEAAAFATDGEAECGPESGPFCKVVASLRLASP